MQTILYHNKLSNIHDIDSYITFMRYAWVDYADVIIMFVLIGLIMGVLIARYYIDYHLNSNSEVSHNG